MNTDQSFPNLPYELGLNDGRTGRFPVQFDPKQDTEEIEAYREGYADGLHLRAYSPRLHLLIG